MAHFVTVTVAVTAAPSIAAACSHERAAYTIADAGRILFLTHGDTDVLAVASIAALARPAAAAGPRPQRRPPARRGRTPSRSSRRTVPGAAIVLVKLHGGVRSLPGFAELVRIAARERAWVVAMPGTDDLDPELTAYSTGRHPASRTRPRRTSSSADWRTSASASTS